MKILEDFNKIEVFYTIKYFKSIEKIHFNELKIKTDLNIYL